MKISVIIPCLNEIDTVANCVKKAVQAIKTAGVSGEVIVADNGSIDGSQALAENAGARIVNIKNKGYGNALMGGIAEAKGEYIMMGDADESYDFSTLPAFLSKLEEGYDLVQGCRLETGGGKVLPGAMPFLHRWVGNPFFSWMVRVMFNAPVRDVNCGMRAFRKDLYLKLDQQCTGMEFAVEMVLKSSLVGAKIAEIPITLHPDGRIGKKPHLRTFRDGWRTLVFFLVSSPRWLFLYPGIFLTASGFILYLIGMLGLNILGVRFDINTLMLSAIFILAGHQTITFALAAKIYGMVTGLLPFKEEYKKLFKKYTLEKGLILGFISMAVGLLLFLYLLFEWQKVSFGKLDAASSIRMSITSMILFTLGLQTTFSSFFFSILGLRFKKKD